ncbi:hypothetical protein AKJ65_03285 [candidate division MSBL1 archaeon SCGC-AAA259E19]|uniref:Calcineurin-like phosphoesterase domain-containing protein n=1 Tax=candidate division MSBL1 archaeon SCGC-AAA259E19 TaxID=1698264 RepID=A0A133UKV9_9EURY|nr:hypothetical protein AKJ65_03285 [candidate division MSBL1 archaeon SCGC-AAA259E19]
MNIPNKLKSLVVGDLHFGVSYEIFEEKEEVFNHINELREELSRIIEENSADRLVLLGDIKHNVPAGILNLSEILSNFFLEMKELIDVEIVLGNHDKDIEPFIPEDICLHGGEGTNLGENIGLFHGHSWPSPDTLRNELVVMAHEHPYIEEREGKGKRTTRPVWIKTRLNKNNLPERLSGALEDRNPEFVIIPAFNELATKGTVNRKIPEEWTKHHPFFRNHAIELDRAEIYSLTGNLLGELKNLRID